MFTINRILTEIKRISGKEMQMILVVRHFPDRKRPCIVLEEGNKSVVIGYLINEERETWLKEAFDCENNRTFAIKTPSTIFEMGGNE